MSPESDGVGPFIFPDEGINRNPASFLGFIMTIGKDVRDPLCRVILLANYQSHRSTEREARRLDSLFNDC
jgi:hypothetical protein